MIASDLVRAVVALGFILTVDRQSTRLLYLLSALLMFASPFFTSGRAAILPVIATREELHTANSLTQTTQWTTLTHRHLPRRRQRRRTSATSGAFVFNALSFLVSALCISRLRVRPAAASRPTQAISPRPRSCAPGTNTAKACATWPPLPLILGIALVGVGWATGGGAAQILFSLFGELVFNRGAAGIGQIWGCAGIGLHGRRRRRQPLGQATQLLAPTSAPSSSATSCTAAPTSSSARCTATAAALFFIGLSRAAVAVSSVLNFSQLLRHVSDEYRGRVFSTMESMVWSTMMISMIAAGVASPSSTPRIIGAVAGVLSSTTAIFWGWADVTGRLPEPALAGVDPEEMEVHGEPTV